MDVERVAFELKLKKATINRWLRDETFRKKMETSVDRVEFHDAKFRSTNNKLITNALYDEIHRRIVDGESLKNINLPTLVKVVKELNFEIRLDDGESTSSTKHEHSIDELMERYENSLSSGYNGRELKLIEKPKQLREKQNG